MTEENVRSLHCTQHELLKVRFINCCDKSVKILWVTYQGHHQLYASLRTRQFVDVNTYMRHAWVFKEDGTGKRVMANNKPYFYGLDEFLHVKPESRAGIRFGVVLSNKVQVDRLEKICINLISRHLLRQCSDVKYLEIPIVLKRRLIKEMHMLYPTSHSTVDILKICEKNLHDFGRIS